MKKVLLLLISFMLILPVPDIKAEVLDKILVVVNDEAITQRELDRTLLPIYTQYKSIYDEEELALKMDEARTGVLQQMIIEKLILHAAKRQKIEVKDLEIEEELDRIKKQFATDEEFETVMRLQGLTQSDLKKISKEKIMMRKLIDKDVRSKIKITPLEMDNYYNEHLEEFKAPQMVRARSILLKIKPDRDYDATFEFAKKLLQRLQEGSDFAELARLYSDGSYADSGGDMGDLKKGDMIEHIDNILFSLNEGEISGILKTDIGFHIFKVEERKSSEIQKFNDVKDRIEQILYAEKFRQKFGAWVNELKNNAYISIK